MGAAGACSGVVGLVGVVAMGLGWQRGLGCLTGWWHGGSGSLDDGREQAGWWGWRELFGEPDGPKCRAAAFQESWGEPSWGPGPRSGLAGAVWTSTGWAGDGLMTAGGSKRAGWGWEGRMGESAKMGRFAVASMVC